MVTPVTLLTTALHAILQQKALLLEIALAVPAVVIKTPTLTSAFPVGATPSEKQSSGVVPFLMGCSGLIGTGYLLSSPSPSSRSQDRTGTVLPC